jgi:hypothetical protein
VTLGDGAAAPLQEREAIMSNRENMPMQKSLATSGRLDENDLKKVTGGDKAGAKQTLPKETVSFVYGSIAWT